LTMKNNRRNFHKQRREERKAFRDEMRTFWEERRKEHWHDHSAKYWDKRFRRHDFHQRSPFYEINHKHRPGWLFARFIGLFGMLALFVLGGIAIVGFLISRLFEVGTTNNQIVWFFGLLFLFLNIIIIIQLSRKAFSSVTNPLSEIMSASESVTKGDFSVRVPSEGMGEFSDLSYEFNKMVEELERSENQRRNLTADVAHELRTPLQIIRGNLEGILDGVYEPDRETVNSILEETHLLTRLVEDLRLLSLTETGQLSLNLEKVDPVDLVEDLATSFSGIADANGIDLELEIDPSIQSDNMSDFSADIDRLNQVLGNLISNAIRHTPSGGKVKIGLDNAHDYVQIRIVDNGDGIPEEDLPYVFNRFWKGDRSRTHTNGAGSGLGLAIAKQLVEAHRGDISVSSEEGQGTQFTIRFMKE